jgi:nucleotide-binding universal stress UspA family protein
MKTSLEIVFATDYSEAVMNAERYAVQFAVQTDSLLQILHVFNSPLAERVPEPGTGHVDSNPVLLEMKKLKDHVNKLLDIMHTDKNLLRFENVIREGEAGRQICDEAKELKADLIIMGSHGETGFRPFMMGNHTWHVIRNAEMPVLTVPKHGLYTGLKNVVYITEYRKPEIKVIDFLADFVGQFQAELTVLHISNYDISSRLENEMAGPFLRELRDTIKYPHLNIKTIHHDNIVEGLNNFCTNERADWLVSAVEKLPFLERIFVPSNESLKKMTFHSHIPLLTISDEYAAKKTPVLRNLEMAEVRNA